MTGSSSKLLQNSRQMALLQIQGKYKANGTQKKTWGKKKTKTILHPFVHPSCFDRRFDEIRGVLWKADAGGTSFRDMMAMSLRGHRWWSPWVLHSLKIFMDVGGLEPWNFMTFHSVGNFIIPTDDIFQRGMSTTNQWCSSICVILCLTFRCLKDIRILDTLKPPTRLLIIH